MLLTRTCLDIINGCPKHIHKEEPMEKVIRIGTVPVGGSRASVFCKIKYKEGKLSISGVVGPNSSGNCRGSCGQINMEFCRQGEIDPHKYTARDFHFAPGWDSNKYYSFFDIWDKWHLNDMRAGCSHQRASKWEWERINPKELPDSHANRDERGIIATWVTPKEHPKGLLTKKCPVCGYRYGTAWLKEEVPVEALAFLRKLPDTDRTPAWV